MQGTFVDQENGGAQLGQQALQQGPSACKPAASGPQPNEWQPSWAARAAQPLRLDVRQTPLGSGTEWGAPPVSCPSRLQHSSPARDGSGGCCLFDPFASSQEEMPGGTPLGAQQPAAAPRAAPPAVQRKPAAECSPGRAPPPPSAPHFAGRVQSCPPERVGRRGARPLVRLRVKRSLSGAVAAAGGPSLARRSLDAGSAAAALAAAPQLAGCSRKRFDAELLSPPVPRKNSRTLLDEAAAAELMMGRLQLAHAAAEGGADASTASGGGAAAPLLMHWDALLPLAVQPSQPGGCSHGAGA